MGYGKHPGPPPKPWVKTCEHQTELRVLTCSNGTEQIRRQCVECGEVFLPAIKREPGRSYPPLDSKARRNNELVKLSFRDYSKQQWWDWYKLYLDSYDWKVLREQVLRRAGRWCEMCKQDIAKQAHHLTYERVGYERLEDLLAVCCPCHEELHSNKILSPARSA